MNGNNYHTMRAIRDTSLVIKLQAVPPLMPSGAL